MLDGLGVELALLDFLQLSIRVWIGLTSEGGSVVSELIKGPSSHAVWPR